MRLCECGCGEPVIRDTARYLRGHHLRVEPPSWDKGDQTGYRAIHTWLNKHFPKRGVCDECGHGVLTDYALIHGQEHGKHRDRYRELCRRCHNAYDEVGGSRWRGYVSAEKQAGEQPGCRCGCGTPVGFDRDRKRWRRYAPGHYVGEARRLAQGGDATP